MNRSNRNKFVTVAVLIAAPLLRAQQTSATVTTQQEVQRLAEAVNQAQAQVDRSQQQLRDLKQALLLLEQRVRKEDAAPVTAAEISAAGSSSAADAELRERQAMQESQIATLDQSKVESESKYPLKISGLILWNGFVNTSAVDLAPSPAAAVPGSGSTGISFRQTVLGIDARGPHLAGASSHADLRVDFFGSGTPTTYADVGGFVRLRTAHAALEWQHTRAFAELDRPLISPASPTSLVSVAQPPLAWSGNLWAWVPQIGASHAIAIGEQARLHITGALVDVPDPPALTTAGTNTVSEGEGSRWPGAEVHLGLESARANAGPTFGVGGYFSPHRIPGLSGYNAWAATLHFGMPLSHGLQLDGSFYRGLALGGLGGGSYKDYVVRGTGSYASARPLDDVGGWAQLKQRVGAKLELNGAFGIDNAFARELRAYPQNPSIVYRNLARNRTTFINAIYSPSSYLLFSLEYRRIWTTPIAGATATADAIGIAAGYKF